MAQIDEKRMQVKIARLYYERNMTQAEIARHVGFSRQKVQRLLNKARENGTVDILVKPVVGAFPELELGLEEKFGLRDAVVIETADYDDKLAAAAELAAAGAEYLCGLVENGERIAVTWGYTVLQLTNALFHHPRPNVRDIEVVQAFGSMGDTNYQEHIMVLTQRLANYFGAQGIMLTAPAIVASAAVRDAFYSDPAISAVLNKARNATLIISGLGEVDENTTFPEPSPFFELPSPKEMSARGAVGEVNLRFFGADGQAISAGIDDRIVGLTLAEMAAIDTFLLIVGGSQRFNAVKAALAGGLGDILITDHITAGKLLQ